MNFRFSFLVRLIFCLSLFFLLGGCKKENRCDCIKRTGEIVKEKRNISGFTQLLVKDNVNVFITQDSVFDVTVEAGDNLVPLITTNLDGNTLVCENKNRCNWTRSYKKPINVHVRMPTVSIIEASGTGNIVGMNKIKVPNCYILTRNSGNVELTIDTPTLTTAMHGSADVVLHGYAHDHACDIGGSGFLKAADMFTEYTYLHTYTLGLCYVYVHDLFICKIDQKGDIYAYGNPKYVGTTYNSSGKLYLQ